MSGNNRHLEDVLPENASAAVELRVYRNGNPPSILQVEGMDEARSMLAQLI
jgi:hypothetical protein